VPIVDAAVVSTADDRATDGSPADNCPVDVTVDGDVPIDVDVPMDVADVAMDANVATTTATAVSTATASCVSH
jgi:hypothetical protein